MLKTLFFVHFPPRSSPDVHSDRADAESGHVEVPARLHRDGIGDGEFYRSEFGVAIAACRAAVRSSGSYRGFSRRGFHYRDKERRQRLASAEAGGAGRDYGAFH